MLSEESKKMLFDMAWEAEDDLAGEHIWDFGYYSKAKRSCFFGEVINELDLMDEYEDYCKGGMR